MDSNNKLFNKKINIFNQLYCNRHKLFPNDQPNIKKNLFFIFWNINNRNLEGKLIRDEAYDEGGLTRTVFFSLGEYFMKKNDILEYDEETNLFRFKSIENFGFNLSSLIDNDKDDYNSIKSILDENKKIEEKFLNLQIAEKIKFLGKIIGLCILSNINIPIKFDPLILFSIKINSLIPLLNEEIIYNIINDYNPDLFDFYPYGCLKHICDIKKNKLTGCLYDENYEKISDNNKIISENLKKIIKIYENYSILLDLFFQGLNMTFNISNSLLYKLSTKNISILITGDDEVTLEKLFDNLYYDDNDDIDNIGIIKCLIKYYYDLYKKEEKHILYLKTLLRATTGYYIIPNINYAIFPLRIIFSNVIDGPIKIETCFNKFQINISLLDKFKQLKTKEELIESDLYGWFSMESLTKLISNFSME